MTQLFLHINFSNHYGIILLIIGLFIRYQIARRRFNRRSMAAVQIFSSYLKGLLTTIIETLVNLLGALLIVVGLISIIMHL